LILISSICVLLFIPTKPKTPLCIQACCHHLGILVGAH
jgi:hypothetical protein